MDADLPFYAQSELKLGEQLLWSGSCISRQGKQSKAAGPGSVLVIGAFLGVWSGFIVSALIKGSTGRSLFGVIIPITVLAGLGLAHRHFHPNVYYRRKRTIYALTDRRVFVLRDLPGDRQVRSIPLQFITRISVQPQSLMGGVSHQVNVGPARGTVIFDASPPREPQASAPDLRFFMTSYPHKVATMTDYARRSRIELLSETSTYRIA